MDATKPSPDLLALVKRAVELCQPDLRKFYRVVRKARVEASYASDGGYFADVQPLRNDESVDEAEPVIPRVEIPILWGGPERGVVCPPAEGTLCDLEYYDGDPSYPRISNFRWQGQGAPACELGQFIIQLEPGVCVTIDKDKNIVALTSKSGRNEAGKTWTIQAGERVHVKAPQVDLEGLINASGPDGATGQVTLKANVTIDGDLTVTGNSQAGTRTGGRVPGDNQ